MIYGTFSVKRVVEKSTCRLSSKGEVTLDGTAKIHSTALMPGIPFGKSKESPFVIDSTMFLNSKKTKLKVPITTKTQNYLSTTYNNTRENKQTVDGSLGDKFEMTCEGGIPGDRTFK